MTKQQKQKEILRLKRERDIFILAHSYNDHEITEIADITGDSYRLATAAKQAKQKTVLVTGVRFMAETVKILCPEKKVLLAQGKAGCPMAQQLTPACLRALKEKYPQAAVAAYINTTAELKALADVCVTSSSAVKVLSRLNAEEILFVPDINLGRYVQKQLPQKRFYFFEGGCPVHVRVNAESVKQAKRAHPDALLLVHPECLGEVTALADYVGSTSGIMEFAKESKNEEFIIGTESTIAEHLRYECPNKKFYPLSNELVCGDMRLTTLESVVNSLTGGGEEIVLEESIRLAAKKSIDKMIELGG